MSKIKDLIQQHCPNGVEYKKLGEVCEIKRGRGMSKSVKNPQATFPIILYGELYTTYGNYIDTIYSFASEKCVKTALKVYRDSILLPLSSTTAKAQIGKASVLKMGCCYLGGDALALIPNRSINPDFLMYFMNGSAFEYRKMKCVKGTTIRHLNPNQMAEIEIPIPPMEVQEEIVRILDTFSALTAELEAELEARKKQYQYYRDKLLSFENLNGGGYKNVIYKTLGEIAEIGTGFQNRKDAISLGMYPLYVRSKDILRTNNYFFDEEAIIIPGEGGIGEIFHYINGKYGLHQRAYRVHVTTNELKTKFLYYFFKSSFKKFISSKAVNATVMSIRKPMLEQFVIPIPSMEEQERVVGILDKFERLVNDISEGIPAEIKARRQQYEYYRDMLLNFKKL